MINRGQKFAGHAVNSDWKHSHVLTSEFVRNDGAAQLVPWSETSSVLLEPPNRIGVQIIPFKCPTPIAFCRSRGVHPCL